MEHVQSDAGAWCKRCFIALPDVGPCLDDLCEHCGNGLNHRTSVDDCPENFHNHNDPILDAPGALEPDVSPDMP